jgi:hypothetical protein
MMKKAIIIFLVPLILLSFSNEESVSREKKRDDPEYVHRALKLMTDVMVHDIYSPPVAGRTYAYISIAAYEASLPGYPGYRSLAGQLHGLKALPRPRPGKEYDYALASAVALLSVGKTMVVSEEKVAKFTEAMLKEFKAGGTSQEVFNNSVLYGQSVAKHIIDWAAGDNYKQTRTFSKYSPTRDAASWKPTPPSYMKAVEPHWNKIRTFIIDSAQQFKPPKPTPFSTDKSSQFYKEALAVHDAVLKLTNEEKHIANFWDCNPFKMNINGHVMYASKKISPGGHWMNITRQVCRQSGANLVQSVEAYASLAITIADAFSSCWDEKYRSLVIRPETYINKYISGNWLPLLQTPPFPEYTSGHSVLSTASAVLLTKLFGENLAFTDSTELEFGIPVRSFKSFMHAAEEAAISRFYGGIHYMPSITNGVEEGKEIGQYVVRRLITRAAGTAAVRK